MADAKSVEQAHHLDFFNLLEAVENSARYDKSIQTKKQQSEIVGGVLRKLGDMSGDMALRDYFSEHAPHPERHEPIETTYQFHHDNYVYGGVPADQQPKPKILDPQAVQDKIKIIVSELGPRARGLGKRIGVVASLPPRERAIVSEYLVAKRSLDGSRQELGLAIYAIQNEARGLGDPEEFYGGGPKQEAAGEIGELLEKSAIKYEKAAIKLKEAQRNINRAKTPEMRESAMQRAAWAYGEIKSATKDIADARISGTRLSGEITIRNLTGEETELLREIPKNLNIEKKIKLGEFVKEFALRSEGDFEAPAEKLYSKVPRTIINKVFSEIQSGIVSWAQQIVQDENRVERLAKIMVNAVPKYFKRATSVAATAGKFGFVIAAETIAIDLFAQAAEAAGFRNDADVADAIKTKLDQITTSQGRQPHPADLSKQPSIGSRGSRPGDLKNESVLGERPTHKEPVLEWEETKRFFSNHPKIRATKNLYVAIETAQNWFARVMMAFVKTAEDPRTKITTLGSVPALLTPQGIVRSVQDLSLDTSWEGIPYMSPFKKENWEVYKEHYSSEQSKRFMATNTQVFDPFARMMYTAWKLGNTIFQEPTLQNIAGAALPMAGAVTLDDAFGRKFQFTNALVLKKIRNISSDEGFENWKIEHGDLFVNAPLVSIVYAADPMLAAVVGAGATARAVRYAHKTLSGLGKNATREKVEEALAYQFHGMPLTEGLIEKTWGMVKSGQYKRAAVNLTALGAYEPGVMDMVIPKYWRQPGHGMSDAERTITMMDEQAAQKVNALWVEKVLASEKHMTILRDLTPDERIDLLLALHSYDSVEEFTRNISAGNFAPTNRRVVDAFTDFQVIAARYMMKMKDPKYWVKLLPVRMHEVDGMLNRYRVSLAKQIHEGVGDVKRAERKLESIKDLKAWDLQKRAEVTLPQWPTPAMLQKWYGDEAKLRDLTKEMIDGLPKKFDIPDTVTTVKQFMASDDRPLITEYISSSKIAEQMRELGVDPARALAPLGGKVDWGRHREVFIDSLRHMSKIRQYWLHGMKNRVQILRKVAQESTPKEFVPKLKEVLLNNLREQFRKAEGEAGLIEKHGSLYIEEVLLPNALVEMKASAKAATDENFYNAVNQTLNVNERLATSLSDLDIPRKMEYQSIRLMAKEHASIPFYWMAIPVKKLKELSFTGELPSLPKLRERVNWQLRHKTTREGPEMYRRRLREIEPDKILDTYEAMMGHRLSEIPRQEGQLRFLKLRDSIDETIDKLQGYDAGPRRDMAIESLQRFRDMAMKKINATPKEQDAFFLQMAVLANNTIKQGMLMVPPYPFVVANSLENVGKGVMEYGLRFLTERPSLYGVDGQYLAPYFFKGEEVLGKLGVAGTDARGLWEKVPGIKQMIHHGAKMTSTVEESTRVQTGVLAYWDKMRLLDKEFPDMPVAEKVTHAISSGRDAVQRVQFYLEPASEAAKAFDLVYPFGWYYKESLQFTTNWMLEHPALTSSLFRFNDAIRESSLVGENKLRLPGGSILDYKSSQMFFRIQEALERTPNVHLSGEEENKVFKNLKVMTGVASEFVRESPFIDLAAIVVKGTTQALRTGDPEMHQRAIEALRAMDKVLAPVSKAVKVSAPLTGATSLSDMLMQMGAAGEEGRGLSKRNLKAGAAFERAAAQLSGESIGDGEAEERFLQHEAGERAASLFGLQIKQDPTGFKTILGQAKDFYNGIEDVDTRSSFYNSFKGPNGQLFLKDMVTRPEKIPHNHPESNWLDEWNAAPEDKKLEMLQDATPKQRKGIMDFMFQSLRDLRLKNPFAPREAFAGDYTPPNDAPIGAFHMVVIDDKLREAGLLVTDLSDKKPFTNRAILNPDGNTFSLQGWRRGFTKGESSKADRKEYVDLTNKWNIALKTLMLDVETAFDTGNEKELDLLRKRPIVVERRGQDLISISASQFFRLGESGKPILYETLRSAKVEGVTNEAGGIVRWDMYDKHSDFMNWIGDPTMLPLRMEIAKEKKQRIDNDELRRLYERMKDTIRYPSAANNAALLSYQIDDALAKGNTTFAPKDFYTRLASSTIPDAQRTLAEFAVAIKAEHLDALYTAVRPRGKFNEKLAQNYLAYGWGPEFQILASHDKDISKFVSDHGGAMDPSIIYGEELLKFAVPRGIPVDRELFIKANVAIPDVDRFASYPEQDRLIEGSPVGEIQAEQKQSQSILSKGEAILSGMQAIGAVGWNKSVEPKPFIPTRAPKILPEVAYPQIGPQQSVGDLLRASTYYTAAFNNANKAREALMEKGSGVPIPADKKVRTNFFAMAAHALPNQDPTMFVSGAAGIMGLGHAFGFVGSDELRVIYRGLRQSQLMGAGQQVADIAVTAGANAAAWLHNRSLPVDQRIDWVHPRDRIGPMAEAESARMGLASKAGVTGSMFTLASGFVAGAETRPGQHRDLTTGLGATGGALQGASVGMQFGGPWGGLIGAAIGASIGGFLGSQRDEEEDKWAEMRELQKARLKQEIASSEERQQAFREDREARGIAGRERALNIQPRGQRPSASKQLMSFLRRPTFASSQGLVRQVEGSMGRAFTPRW